MLLNTYEAAATLTVGTDAFRNEQRNVSSQNRVMSGIAVVGSAAINDCSVDVYIEDYYVGNFRNSKAGVIGVDLQQDIRPVGPHAVPAGSKMSAIIRVAPTTSPLLITVI